MNSHKQSFDIIVFDLGGVLIELSGVPRMIEWTGNTMSVDELWSRWLASPTVRAFEKGETSADEFAAGMVSEFHLPVDETQFLHEFITWPRGWFHGVVQLLENIGQKYKIASLSNTNSFHWGRVTTEFRIEELIQFNFPSHLTGLLKPDREAFENVINTLSIPPDRILFFDDNQINIDAAITVGFHAYRVSSFEALSSKIHESLELP